MAELISIPAPSVIENYQDMEVMVLGSNQVAQGTQFRIWAYEGVSSFFDQ